jgi:FkbM family methyltransferase
LFGFIRRTLSKIKEPWVYSNQWARKSYAQEGEDLILDRLIDGTPKGFYVEVGSHHPFRFSNTFLFYRRGWNGICVDPLPGSKLLFNKWRPRDVAIEIGISEVSSHLKYYMFNESALNTFDQQIAKDTDGHGNYKIIKVQEVETVPLSKILDSYLPANQKINILSVDVEGLDLQVLRSNDWSKYRPNYIVAECLQTDLGMLPEDPVATFLFTVGYQAYAKTGNSVIFVERKF